MYAIGPDGLISRPGVAKLKAVHARRHRAASKKKRRGVRVALTHPRD